MQGRRGLIVFPYRQPWEVAPAGDPRHERCTSSGAAASLDAVSSEALRYRPVIPGFRQRRGRDN